MPSHQPDDTSIVSDNNDEKIFLPKKKRLDPRIVLSGIMMFILVSSSGLALVAQNRDTDNRSSASEGEMSDFASEPCVETPGNLIKNPSFESNFINWSKGKLINRAVLASGSPHCGKHVKITFLKSEAVGNDFQRSISQPVQIKPATNYKITLWARTNDVVASLDAYVLSKVATNQAYEERLILTDIYETFFLTNEWQKFEITEKSKDEFSSDLSVLYLASQARKGKSVFIDNIVLTEIPEPTPTFEPTPTASQSAQKRVFVSSTNVTGNLGGLAGADLKCQNFAQQANLDGTWKAWLSDSTTSVASRFNHSEFPYVLINGKVIADNWNDLTDGFIHAPISVDEWGNSLSDAGLWHNYVFTNTTSEGQRSSDNVGHELRHCSNWTSANYMADDSGFGSAGEFTHSTQGWTEGTAERCNDVDTARIYCFEQ